MGYFTHPSIFSIHNSDLHCAQFLVGRDIGSGCEESAGKFEESEHVDPRAEEGFGGEVDREENQPECADRWVRHRVYECD